MEQMRLIVRSEIVSMLAASVSVGIIVVRPGGTKSHIDEIEDLIIQKMNWAYRRGYDAGWEEHERQTM